MENQTARNTGMSYSGWRDAFEGLACRFSLLVGLTGDKQSDCPQNRGRLRQAPFSATLTCIREML